MKRTTCVGLGLVLLLASGCQSLRYHSNDELWAGGDAAFDRGDYDEAITYYDELLRRDDGERRALLMRGVAHERTAETRAALEDYAKAGTLGEHRALLYRANINIKRGDTGAAEADLGQLRNAGLSGSDQVIQLTLIGTLRLMQGQPRMAVKTLEQAISAGQGSGRHVRDAHYNAAQAYYQLGDFGRAYDHYLAYSGGGSVSRFGEPAAVDATDAYMLGLLAYLAGDFDAADAHLSRADPEQVAEAAQILDDPSFGAGMMGGAK